MKKIKKYIIMLTLLLMVLTGCSNSSTYLFKLYENGSSEFKMSNEEKIHEVDKIISNIKDNSEVIEKEKFEIPKGFTYELSTEDEILYQFASGYMIYKEKVYTVTNYTKVIKELKELFKK